uniref:Uncharacterized protein n=1 Tax=Marseillevirus sp. TaxID=2809551 RepID=A0AA96EKD0_9VIRU|nr:hypothetical protein MarFTMF_454 [Marseillevirus sp.]
MSEDYEFVACIRSFIPIWDGPSRPSNKWHCTYGLNSIEEAEERLKDQKKGPYINSSTSVFGFRRSLSEAEKKSLVRACLAPYKIKDWNRNRNSQRF